MTNRLFSASCIRGHRSQRCEHHDRPLLKLRRKGRPTTSQCDRCRDLRRALGVHERCICEPDAFEAPKRRGQWQIYKHPRRRNIYSSKDMVKKPEVETVSERPIRCLNSTAALVDPLLPLPLPSSVRIPPSIPSSIPLGGQTLLGNEPSQTLRSLNPGSPARCISGSDRCCTRPLASLDRNGEESHDPMERVHSNRKSSRLNSHKLTLRQNLRP